MDFPLHKDVEVAVKRREKIPVEKEVIVCPTRTETSGGGRIVRTGHLPGQSNYRVE